MTSLSWESVARRTPGSRPLVMGHRGAPEVAPENTLASFSLALEQGADVLETDLRFTSDDRLVLIHDPSVDRTTGGSGQVSQMSLSEIKRLRTIAPPSVSGAMPGLQGEPPPTLDELLELTRGEVPLALELKDDRFLSRKDAGRLTELLSRRNAIGTTVLVSFSLPRLLTFRSLEPKLPLGLITLSRPLPLSPTEFLGPFYPLLYVDPFYAWWARRIGKIVCPLDTSPEPRLRYYRLLGVPVVMTNHTAATVRALSRVFAQPPCLPPSQRL